MPDLDESSLSFPSNFDVATKDLKLSPQEQNLYNHHLTNLLGGGKVTNPDGSISTIFQAAVGNGDKTYNIPTVWGGKILPVPQAIEQVEKTGGWNRWPSYPSVDEAEARYGLMHDYMGEDTGRYIKQLTEPAR